MKLLVNSLQIQLKRETLVTGNLDCAVVALQDSLALIVSDVAQIYQKVHMYFLLLNKFYFFRLLRHNVLSLCFVSPLGNNG